jgi:1,2-dihydroxy-3-keto-5-methylthiopentene dioxygenase
LRYKAPYTYPIPQCTTADRAQGVDQRELHDSGREVAKDYLGKLGVLYYRFADVADVDKLAAERSYKNRDVITVSPEKMGDVYEEKVKMFFNEHLHEDEEIRYIRDGTGFFDVRSEGDEWVRIQLEKDDLIVRLSCNIYGLFFDGIVDFASWHLPPLHYG